MEILNEEVKTTTIMFPILDGWGDPECFYDKYNDKIRVNMSYKHVRILRAEQINSIKSIIPEMIKEIGNWMRARDIESLKDAMDVFYYSRSRVCKPTRKIGDIEVTCRFQLYGYSGWSCTPGVEVTAEDKEGKHLFWLNATIEDKDIF